MRKTIVMSALAILVVAAPVVLAGPAHTVESREGDNTIYLTWDAKQRRVTEATSSRRLTAVQQVELLTRLSDTTGALDVRGVLKNVSKDQRYRVRGILVQRILRGSEEFRVRRSPTIHRLLLPGQKVTFSFTYGLPRGSYSVRTDFVRK